MKEISNTNRVFILFGVLSVFINQLKNETYKHGARIWYNKLNNQAREFWKEIQFNVKAQSEDCVYAFDELEAYTVEVLKAAYEVKLEDMDEFIEYIKNFKK
jgi:hypothetical protein